MATMLRGPVERGDSPTVLRAILDPGCALAIWDRRLLSGLAGMVTALDLESVDDIDAILPADAAMIHAAVMLGAAGYEGEGAVALAHEISAMADSLALIMPTERLRVRLEMVETDACRRFHADMVTMRLLVTLCGPGIQWIEAIKPDAIEEIPAGAVAIFKGRRLVEEPTVLHRSPPIAGSGVRRLVLMVDPA